MGRCAPVALALLLACAGPSRAGEATIAITARKWEFSPARIVLHRGVAVTLELTSLDRKHGFEAPGLGLRVVIEPGRTVRLHVVPRDKGTFAFHCDVFCGDGHEGMTGEIVVVD